MNRTGLLVRLAVPALALLSACSDNGQAPPPTPDASAPAKTAQTATPAAASAVTGRTGAAAGLKGQVSNLNSAISGLAVRVTDYGTVIDLPADALFEFDKADLMPGAAEQLAKSAQMIARAPAGPIGIVGHTDGKGDAAYNQRLSEARAQAVADWFAQQVGVRTREFDVSGKGETAPIAPNETLTGKDDSAGRARNRRVEVVLPKPEP